MKTALVFLVGCLDVFLAMGKDHALIRRGLKTGGSKTYKIALWGDLPYLGQTINVFDSGEIGPIYRELVDEINHANVKFSIHAGDVKSGSSPCGEFSYKRFEDMMNAFNHPALLALGDNEWTDCWRLSSGNYDPLERLNYLRQRFYDSSGETIFGTGVLETKSLGSEGYPELQLFDYGGVTYIIGHVVGSNNGLYDGIGRPCSPYLDIIDPGCNSSNVEHAQRNAIVNEFVSRGFAEAKMRNDAGVMVIIQANIFGGPCVWSSPFPDCDISKPINVTSGFQDFWNNLVQETRDFDKPVTLFHGDYHYYQYFSNPGGQSPNLVAVQTPGARQIGWILCTVDAASPKVFSFQHFNHTPEEGFNVTV